MLQLETTQIIIIFIIIMLHTANTNRMTHKIEVVELVETMQSVCRRLAREGKRIRFVPTMGSLHAGHASLIRRAKEDDIPEATIGEPVGGGPQKAKPDDESINLCRLSTSGDKANLVVIVSIFVNPTQFNDRQDFIKYPKTLEKDLHLCQRLNVDYVFVPKCEHIYQDPPSATCSIKPPESISNDLEGKSRPGHFEGMLTIVCKLFNIIRPNAAYFGEKDYQQLILVTKMVKSLNMDVKICPVETTRDQLDQLPLSSRNVRLNEKQRQAASIMYEILLNAKDALEDKCKLVTMTPPFYINSSEPCDPEITIIGSMFATQYLNLIDDEDMTLKLTNVDYLELRCAQDFSVIQYDHDLGGYDCQDGCAKSQVQIGGDIALKTRLLISIIVAGTRLLDNIEVILNL